MSVATGMPQPGDARAARVERGVDRGGDDHSAQRRGDGKRSLAHVLQLAMHDLALDLGAHDEEEDDHQHVVDDVLEALFKGPDDEVDRDVGVPEVFVEVVRGVGPDHRDDGGDHEHDPAGGLDLHEAQGRLDDEPTDRPGALHPRWSIEVGHHAPPRKRTLPKHGRWVMLPRTDATSAQRKTCATDVHHPSAIAAPSQVCDHFARKALNKPDPLSPRSAEAVAQTPDRPVLVIPAKAGIQS